jgi:hypothetical protein
MKKAIVEKKKNIVDSDSETSSESDKEFTKKVILKKAKKYSDNESDSDSDSDNYKKKIVVKKGVLKKSAPKKLVKIEDKVDKKDDTNKIKEDLESIDSLLEKKDYATLEKNIPKYKIITSKDVNNIISSKPRKKQDNSTYYDVELIEKLLDKIIQRGYVMTKENYLEMIKQNSGRLYRLDYKSKVLLKNFSIKDDEIDEFCDFFTKNKIKFLCFEFDKINKDDKKTLENIVYLLCYFDRLYDAFLMSFIDDNKIQITEKHLKYAKSEVIKRYLLKKILISVSEAKKIKTNDKDNDLLKCQTIEEIEDFVNENNYEITPKNIILACQNNINENILNHLLSYKIKFDEASVNEIIKSYRDNLNIEKLLLSMYQYGYEFKKSNYLEMLNSKYFYTLFNGDLAGNFILDDDSLYNIYRVYHRCIDNYYNEADQGEIMDIYDTGIDKFIPKIMINFRKFLSDIENLGHKNKITAEGIIALYCFIGDEEKINKLTKDYDIKLTVKCLKYYYKNYLNKNKKKILDLFKKDKVKPDFDILKQYIETFGTTNGKYLLELLNEE